MNKIDKYMNMPLGERMKALIDADSEVREMVKQKMREEREKAVQEYWENLNVKFEKETDIPQLPNPLEQLHIDKLIQCGAITKKDLVIGKYYYGKCRNNNVAMWNGKEFQYMRYKFGWREDTINHFEDDNGYDLFVPIKEQIEVEEVDKIKEQKG